MRFTEELRESAGSQWDRVVNHKFTDELAEGTLDKEVLKRYLIQDYRFLDAFVVLLSTIISKARNLSDRIPGCQFLALITDKENTYFDRSLVKLGAKDNGDIPDAPCTTAFCNLMLEVAQSGHLGEMLAVIVVCEWSYLLWGERVLSKTKRDDFENYEWVDLHSGQFFAGVVEYLRGLLDKEGELIDDVQDKEKCRKSFLRAVQCEEDFFDFAYSGF
mmetsp:Transcript_9227/g.10707  ORF Transcript_9227/g.10707 Transcript_9227/m.10707 type:complete len:217 (+) Transcript_9227:98-748(+)